ncbi:Na+/H+/K+ antiporter P-type ATPase [Apiospora arundinis]
MDGYEARRLANIKRNAELVQDLGLEDNKAQEAKAAPPSSTSKRRKLDPAPPTRTEPEKTANPRSRTTTKSSRTKGAAAPQKTKAELSPSPPPTARTHPDIDAIRAGWTSWTPNAPPPTRDETTGEYHFASHPDFRPNKSPESILREGAFGGTYFRPLYSKRLGITIEDDWRELPDEWISGEGGSGSINVEKQLTSLEYDPAVNKYGVRCGQSIEEWEAAGWIAHEYDVRGWFQWYCRFWMGRRCVDGDGGESTGEDERQISRWKKCVGETGRWRRILLKKYVQMGVRSVFDEGDDEDDDEVRGEVSPVVHQTCHHWAYEVRQEALNRFWAEGK